MTAKTYQRETNTKREERTREGKPEKGNITLKRLAIALIVSVQGSNRSKRETHQPKKRRERSDQKKKGK
jgi:hypothetical protein